MRIHHLNCGSMCPLSHPVINRFAPKLDQLNLVCHCLLIESNEGLILVDTGLGIQDVRKQERLVSQFIFHQLSKPKLDIEETAFMQIVKLGFNPKDVKHIIVTHFDSDHIGGIADFPEATVHVMRKEWDVANTPEKGLKRRYFPSFWENNKKIETYDETGDKWLELQRVQPLRGISADIQLVSLPGHTQGHCGILIEGHNLFFVGDSFMQEAQLMGHTALPIKIYNKIVHDDPEEAKVTLHKLMEVHRQKVELEIICSHDQKQFKKYEPK